MGLVFAQLYTPDGTCHGLHCFVTPLRDPATLITFPGITIAKMGHKIGLNGIDNGCVIMLTRYKFVSIIVRCCCYLNTLS